MSKGSLAKEYFLSGLNCSQAVLCAFCDETGLSYETSLAISSRSHPMYVIHVLIGILDTVIRTNTYIVRNMQKQLFADVDLKVVKDLEFLTNN